MLGGEEFRASGPAKPRRRQVWFGGEWHDTGILSRDRLEPGGTFTGPAIVEQLDTTTPLHPGDVLTVDPSGCLLIRLDAAGVSRRARSAEEESA